MSTCVLALDTTTAGELACRGHARSKRKGLQAAGLAVAASETGHVPLLYRTGLGNGSDQAVLGSCPDGLGKLHDALGDAQQRGRPGCRTLVWAGGSLRLHTIAITIGQTSVSLARVALGGAKSARGMMRALAGIEAMVVQVRAKERGRHATVPLAPEPTVEQRKAVQTFDLEGWMPRLLSSMTPSASNPSVERVA